MNRTASVSKTNQTMPLADGRTLGFAEYGSAEGNVLIYCQGYPGTRLEAEALDEYGRQAGVRVISLDRPGMGLSSFESNRSFLEWPDDLIVLTDSLQIKRFAIVGVSGGSPYALACAYRIPERLIACGIVSGMGPIKLGATGMSLSNRLIFFLARWFPWLLALMLRSMSRSLQNEEKAKKTMTKTMQRMVKPDRDALLALDPQASTAASTRETFRQGVKGAVYEGGLYGRNWGFRLEDIQFQPLYLWHGELDKNVPVSMARAVACKLANCKATYYSNDGHISVPLNHKEEIVSTLFSSLT